MASRTITSADGQLVLSSSDFALAATRIEGWGADAAWAFEDAQSAETSMGVDGKLSAGWTPRPYPMQLTLQADSDSIDVISGIVLAQDLARTVYRLNGVLTVPGLGKSWTMSRGVLTRFRVGPDAQTTLRPQTFQLVWESVVMIPIA